MVYKGVEYTMAAASPDQWTWQFRIGDQAFAGRIEAKLIDRELKKTMRE